MKKTILQTTGRETIVKAHTSTRSYDNVKRLTIGKWFNVYPKSINGDLLFGSKENKQHQWMARYARRIWQDTYIVPVQPFEVFIPEIPNGKWQSMSAEQLYEIAKNLGGSISNEKQLGLLWAQMITNGQEWESLLSIGYHMVFEGMYGGNPILRFVSSSFFGEKIRYGSSFLHYGHEIEISDYEGCPIKTIIGYDSSINSDLLISTPIVTRNLKI